MQKILEKRGKEKERLYAMVERLEETSRKCIYQYKVEDCHVKFYYGVVIALDSVEAEAKVRERYSDRDIREAGVWLPKWGASYDPAFPDVIECYKD